MGYTLRAIEAGAGNFSWVATFLTTDYLELTDVALDNNGNIYATGEFTDTVDVDPGIDTLNLVPYTVKDALVCKINAGGTLVWADHLGTGTIGSTYKGLQLAVDLDGHVYLTGYFYGTVDFAFGPAIYLLTASASMQNSYVLKINSGGQFCWAVMLHTASNDIKLDHSGNLYTSGAFIATQDFNPGPGVNQLSTATHGPNYVLKLDTSANFIWAKNYGGTILSIDVDMNDNIYTTGFFENTADFDPSPALYLLSATNFTDMFVAKLYSNGNFAWARVVNGGDDDWSYSITTSSNGYVYTTGTFTGSLNFDPPGSYNVTTNGWFDLFISKYNQCAASASALSASACNSYVSPSGNYTWTGSGTYSDTLINFSGCDSVIAVNLTILANTIVSIAALGSTSFCQGDSVTLSASPGLTSYQWYRNFTLIPGATSANFIAKTNGKYKCIAQDGLLCADTSNVISVRVPCIPIGPNHNRPTLTDDTDDFQFAVFPNPGAGRFTISAIPGELFLYDASGNLILTKVIYGGQTDFDISYLPGGLYAAVLRSGNRVFTQKISLFKK
jgi:hypothetical protein